MCMCSAVIVVLMIAKLARGIFACVARAVTVVRASHLKQVYSLSSLRSSVILCFALVFLF